MQMHLLRCRNTRIVYMQAKNLYARRDGQIESYASPVGAESSTTEDSQAEVSEFDIMKKGDHMDQP